MQNLANLAATSSASAWGVAERYRHSFAQLGDIRRDPPRRSGKPAWPLSTFFNFETAN
jgi:hypothetical protein